jgi:hypothetical protein
MLCRKGFRLPFLFCMWHVLNIDSLNDLNRTCLNDIAVLDLNFNQELDVARPQHHHSISVRIGLSDYCHIFFEKS